MTYALMIPKNAAELFPLHDKDIARENKMRAKIIESKALRGLTNFEVPGEIWIEKKINLLFWKDRKSVV